MFFAFHILIKREGGKTMKHYEFQIISGRSILRQKNYRPVGPGDRPAIRGGFLKGGKTFCSTEMGIAEQSG